MENPRFIDVHGHVNFKAFEADYREVIKRTLERNVWLIMPGSQYPTSERAVKISLEFEKKGVWAAVGLHPTHALDMPWSPPDFHTLIKNNRSAIKAIGETGIDYYRVPKDPTEKEIYLKKQLEIFQDHLDLAAKYQLPLIIHCRQAYQDLFLVLQKNRDRLPQLPGLIHCFVGNWSEAQQFLSLGFFISFTGIITFTDDVGLLEAVKNVPLQKLTVETDAPYLTPIPHRGKRNEPLYTEFVARKVAEIKKIPVEHVLEHTTKNAITLFHL